VGLVEDCRVRAGQSFLAAGEQIALLGELIATHLGGSEYLRACHGQKRGMPPPLDYAKEKSVQGAVRAMIRAGLVRTAHDCSDGGLAAALAECAFGNGLGCDVALGPAFASHPALRLDGMLFGEDAARIVIAFPAQAATQIAALAAEHGAPLHTLGTVGGDTLLIRGNGGIPLIDAKVSELKSAWTKTIPAIASR